MLLSFTKHIGIYPENIFFKSTNYKNHLSTVFRGDSRMAKKKAKKSGKAVKKMMSSKKAASKKNVCEFC